MMKYFLTIPEKVAYIIDAIIFRGCPQPPQDAERGVLVLGQVARVSSCREAWGGFLKSRRNTRAFYLPEAKIFRRCYMAQKEGSSISPKEMLESHLKKLQLLTRLLLLSSAYEGFKLSDDDVQSFCYFLLDYIGKVQQTLKEVNDGS